MIKLDARLNGPFATSADIDVHALRKIQGDGSETFNQTYCRLQNEAFKFLKETGDTCWIEPSRRDRKTVEYDTDDFAGTSIIPDFFLECRIPITSEQKYEGVTRNGTANIYSLTRLAIMFHDFGIGTVTLVIESETNTDPDLFRVDIESINSRLADAVIAQIRPKLEAFRAAVNEVTRTNFEAKTRLIRQIEAAPQLKLLWLHRMYIAHCCNEQYNEHLSLANKLLIKHHPEEYKNCSIEDSYALYPSIGCSLAAVNVNHVSNGPAKLERMLNLHNAYNAAVWALDELLFNQILDLRTEQVLMAERKARLVEIEMHAHQIFRLSSTISSFLAIFKNRISRLSPQETILSESICEAWRFKYQTDALEEKLCSLKEMYQITMKLMSDSEARLLNKIIFAFTIISFVTVTTTVIDFVVKSEAPSFSMWRTTAVVLAFLIVFAGGWVVFKRHFRSIKFSKQ